MKEVYVSYNGTLYVPYIAVYVFHGYTGKNVVTRTKRWSISRCKQTFHFEVRETASEKI